MRADLQTILSAATNSATAPISRGQLDEDKQCVLAWLYLKLWAPNVNFNLVTIQNKIAGMQGVTDTNMTDLQIEGLSTYFGYGALTWPQLLAVARGAINGQGIQTTGSAIQTAVVGSQDYITLQNYALLTAAKVLNDAS